MHYIKRKCNMKLFTFYLYKKDGNNTEKGAIALKTTKQFDMNV